MVEIRKVIERTSGLHRPCLPLTIAKTFFAELTPAQREEFLGDFGLAPKAAKAAEKPAEGPKPANSNQPKEEQTRASEPPAPTAAPRSEMPDLPAFLRRSKEAA